MLAALWVVAPTMLFAQIEYPGSSGAAAALPSQNDAAPPPRVGLPNGSAGEGRSPAHVLPAETGSAETGLPDRDVSAPGAPPRSGAAGLPATSGAVEADPPVSPTKAVRQRLEQILAVAAAEFPDARPLSLRDALEGKWQRSQQRDVITAYWQLAASLARLGGLLDSAASFPPAAPAPGAAAAPHTSASGRDAQDQLRLAAAIDRARISVIDDQHQLAVALGRSPSDDLPIPTDVPHVGRYRTRYTELFASNPANGRPVSSPRMRSASRLDAVLPIRHRVVLQTAELLDARNLSVEVASDDIKAFAAAVMQYNLEIAEYAMLVAGEGVEGRRLIPMLIKEKQTEPPARESDDNTARRTNSPPSTFRNQGSSGLGDNPRLAERERRRDHRGGERSVLVDDAPSAVIDEDLQGLVPVRPPAPSDRWRSRSGRSEPGTRVPQ